MRRAAATRALIAAPAAALVLAGCDHTQSSVAPESHQARDIASLFWWMTGVAFLGLGIVVALLLWSWKRRNRRGFGDDTEGAEPGEKASWRVVVGAGIALPIALISALFVISDIFVIQTTEAPASNATRLTVRVTGHDWWWAVRYPGTTAVTANEIHIPVRTPVRVEVRTADVIHSFWVPQLNRKIDTIPGRTNAIELYAERPGSFRGQCAEFCGVQHAHMSLYVVAQPQRAFRRWLANEEGPAAAPSGAKAERGRQLFLDGECATCHTIRGTSAQGYVGPDLTHLQTRTTLGAGTIPNRRDYLRDWIADSQHFKPGNQMPNVALGARRLGALVAYLQGLR